MADRKIVMQALAYGFGNGVCSDRSFRFGDMPALYNVTQLFGDALDLLKEHEPVKAIFSRVYDHDIQIYACGSCGKEMSPFGFVNYCQHCGREVKWE